MKIPRATSAAVENGRAPAWYVWRHFVMLVCPNGHGGVLRSSDGKGHEVGPDGTVTPSVICPSCSFHEDVVLEDWANPWPPN